MSEPFALLQGGHFSRISQLGFLWTLRSDAGGVPSVNPVLTFEGVSKDGRHKGQRNYFEALGADVQPGELYLWDSSVDPAYVPIGSFDDEISGVTRAIYGVYETSGTYRLTEIREAVIPFDDLTPSLDQLVWAVPFTLPVGIQHSMRVATDSRLESGVLSYYGTADLLEDDQLPVCSWLYYILSSGDASRIYYVPINPPVGFTTPDGFDRGQAPKLVCELPFAAEDRFYVVPSHENPGRFILYIGDADRSPLRRTTVVVHEPSTGTVVRPAKVLIESASPFPRSYAAAPGRSEYNLPMTAVILEPDDSREGGGAIDLAQRHEAAFRTGYEWQPSGSSWLLCSCVTDGYFLLDQQIIDNTQVAAYFGGGHAVNAGSWNKVRNWPTFLGRVEMPPPEVFDTSGVLDGILAAESVDADRPTISTEYMLHVSSGQRFDGDRAADAHRFRKGGSLLALGTYRPIFGGNQSETLLGSDLPGLFPHYVGGSLQLAHVGGVRLDDTFYASIGTVANRRDSWRLDDENPFGWPGTSLAPNGSPLDYSFAAYDALRKSASQDVVNGCKAALFAPDRVLIVGWYIAPEEVPTP